MHNTVTLSLKKKIISRAKETLGFDDCRFTSPFVPGAIEKQKDWLGRGYEGDMGYLRDHLPFKENPQKLLPGVKTAIVLIKNYKNTTARRLANPLKIARYAVGKDYHLVMKEKLLELANFLKSEHPNANFYVGVDSSPIPERALALKSGIGFLGKNSMVIKPGLGSYFFIGVILTTKEFLPDQALSWNCGECRLCIDACPTQAIISNGVVDARRCLSYQTIEQKTPMTAEQIEKNRGWLFGCDICQEACPYNHDNTPLTNWKEFWPQAGVGFDFFTQKNLNENSIPRETPLYRSRKRILPNLEKAACLIMQGMKSA